VSDDRWALDRFVQAQARVIEQARAELAAGRKASHWMWFVFPQLKALGRSGTARFYGLESLEEARAYWEHPLLGARLRECVALALQHRERGAHQIFGSPDDLKFCSCLTLFERAAPEEPVFAQALDAFYDGRRDALTLELLAA
jgi:uncharacterized protein (DUF1810 family)